MVDRREGLTKTYNRFHDRDHDTTEANREIVAAIQKLRELHADMDRAVLEAYGWHDLAEKATCEFILDYEDDEDDEDGSSSRRRKKPWRYRWPDDFRDEVLARLLDLNQKRAAEEAAAAASSTAEATGARKRTSRSRRRDAGDGQVELF